MKFMSFAENTKSELFLSKIVKDSQMAFAAFWELHQHQRRLTVFGQRNYNQNIAAGFTDIASKWSFFASERIIRYEGSPEARQSPAAQKAINRLLSRAI